MQLTFSTPTLNFADLTHQFVNVDAIEDSLHEDFHHGLVTYSVTGEADKPVSGVVELFLLSDDPLATAPAGGILLRENVFVGLSHVPSSKGSVKVWVDTNGSGTFETSEERLQSRFHLVENAIVFVDEAGMAEGIAGAVKIAYDYG